MWSRRCAIPPVLPAPPWPTDRKLLCLMQLRRTRRQRQERDAFGSLEVFGAVPSSLIENENGVCAGGDFRCDFVEMELHGLGVASGRHEGSAGSALGAYRAEQNRDLISEADGE